MEAKEVIATTILATVILGSTQVMAAVDKGSFTFAFGFSVRGTTKFRLSNSNTSCDTIEDTWRYNENHILDNKGHYCMELEEKAWFGKRYRGEYHLADGYRHTSWLGKIKKATYVVNLGTNDDLGPSSRQIKGVGTIYQ